MKKKLLQILRYFILILFVSSTLVSQNYVSRQGGLSFRVDDNGLIDQYEDYNALFSNYNAKFNFAVNLANSEFNASEYQDAIRNLQNLGHLMMDHTPSHATSFFITIYDTSLYSGLPGVNHISGSKICLNHIGLDTNIAVYEGYADINDSKIVFSSIDYTYLTQTLQRDGKYFYFPALDTLVLVQTFNHSHKEGHFTDIWADVLNLGIHNSLKYYTLTRDQITITQEAYDLLVNETLKLSAEYNLTPPNIWIQPGGNFPVFTSSQVKPTLVNLGYDGAATYPNAADKVYNEYDPNNDRAFAFQWGDFVEDEMSLETIKSRIADGVAKHQVMINNIHWYSSVGGNDNDWNDYITKMDDLLAWADSNSIPIKKYDEWIDLLYNQNADPYENIIPPLNKDIDENNIPDGYLNIGYVNPNLTGVLIDDSEAPNGKAYYSTYYDNYTQITHILGLGGVEKGANDFSIWTKGKPGNKILIRFSDKWPGKFKKEFEFSADTPNWKKYNLIQSINGIKELSIPDTISLLNIDIYHRTTNPDTIWISGMSMSRKVSINDLNLAILNPETIKAGDSVYIEVSLMDSLARPAVTSFDYNASIQAPSTAEIITPMPLSFKNSSVDTIVVVDTVSGNINLTVSLNNNSSVLDNILISVIPTTPDTLIILSSSDSLTIGQEKIIQVKLADKYSNAVPDSSIQFQILNGNGKFNNDLQTINGITNSSGIAEVYFTSSSIFDHNSDTILVNYSSSLIDTIIFPLVAAPIKNLSLAILNTPPYIAGDTLNIELTSKDIFGNLVPNSLAYTIHIPDSIDTRIISTSLNSFNNSARDTFQVIDTTSGFSNLTAILVIDTNIIDSLNIQISHNDAHHINILSSEDSIIVGTNRILKIALEDRFSNPIPDSNITLHALNGNSKFSNDLQTINLLTNNTGYAEVLYTASTNASFLRDSIEVKYNSNIVDTIIIPLKSASVAQLSQIILNTETIIAGDTIKIEILAKDIFGNDVNNSMEFNIHYDDSIGINLISERPLKFSNSSKDTVLIQSTKSGKLNILTEFISDTTINASSEVEIFPNAPLNVRFLTNIDTVVVNSNVSLHAELTDTFSNVIPNTLLTFTSNNGKFSNNLSTLLTQTDSNGIATVEYTSSSFIEKIQDSIFVSFSQSIKDTATLYLLSGVLSKLKLTTISSLPAYDGDSVLVEVTAMDSFDNPIITTNNYYAEFLGSNSAKILNDSLKFNTSARDTLIILDSLAGSFDLIIKLSSDTLITDTATISIEYSEKQINIIVNVEGAYDSIQNKMNSDLSANIPLTSPYSTAPDTVSSLNNEIVDWILVDLKKDKDPDNPNPLSVVDVISKSAFLRDDGSIVDPHSLSPIGFKVPEGYYYILITHRNHLKVMSANSIHFTR